MKALESSAGSKVCVKSLKFNIGLCVILTSFPVCAVECQWWQTKVKAASVPTHRRLGQPVEKHLRKEHCREKWVGADTYVKQLRSEPVQNWPHKEVFKRWARSEMEILLQLLPSLPAWTEVDKYKFHRSKKADVANNPARSELVNGLIILYDSFFSQTNQASIVIHEVAHHHYQRLSHDDREAFKGLSGWTSKVDFKSRTVLEHPPTKLIKPDSSTSVDEDFSNHVEEYFRSSSKYKKSHPELHKFFTERLSK